MSWPPPNARSECLRDGYPGVSATPLFRCLRFIRLLSSTWQIIRACLRLKLENVIGNKQFKAQTVTQASDPRYEQLMLYGYELGMLGSRSRGTVAAFWAVDDLQR